MTIAARIVVRERGVDVAVTVPAGGALALLGPNGSGKTTVLESIAGILKPGTGRIEIDGRVVFDSESGAWVSPQRRRAGLVSQASELFTTMTVLDNVAFGPRSSGASKEDAAQVADEWLERVGAAGLASRRPDELSAGEARRVAIARALAPRPSVLLLDEPFAGLDLDAATGIRSLLADLIPGRTTLLSTHNALDAHALAGDVAILDHGGVVDSGPTASVLARPRTTFAARMGARVLLTGTISSGRLALETGQSVGLAPHKFSEGTRAAIALHPSDLRLNPADGDGIADEVRALEPHGDLVRVHGRTMMADVPAEFAAHLTQGTPARFAPLSAPEPYALE
jgi:molybdate transport system ATP-binding protein